MAAPKLTSETQLLTARHFGTGEQTFEESLNMIRNHFRIVRNRFTYGGIYTRMFNYLKDSCFTKIVYVETDVRQRNALNYAKYQVRRSLLLVREKMREQKLGYTHEISYIINHLTEELEKLGV